MCTNASPLKEFIAKDTYVDVEFKEHPLTPSTFNETVKYFGYLLNTTWLSNYDQNNPNGIEWNYIFKNESYETLLHKQDILNGIFVSKSHLFSVPEVKFEDYRDGIQSWFSWQDSFILPVFILLALLSIGAIVAFKVELRSNTNHI